MVILDKLKLAYLWVVRILFAPNNFGVSLFNRVRYSIMGGYMPDQVALYDFAHNNPKEYLSEFDWYRSRSINDPFNPMLNNKVICTDVLKPHVKVPEIFFIKNKGSYIDPLKPHIRSSAEAALMVLERERTVFMKPISLGKGLGAHRIDFTDNKQYLIDGEQKSAAAITELFESKDGWFLSEFVEQHKVLANIFSETTNTIRFITLRDPKSGEITIFFAVLRIGTAATVPVDNGSRGGLVAKIDLETGELSEGRPIISSERFTHHPNSGEPIKGVVLPGWDSLKTEMLELTAKFSYLNFIAWDILLTDEGFCIIEANTSSGVNIIQIWGPQRNGKLGDFYRFHKVIK